MKRVMGVMGAMVVVLALAGCDKGKPEAANTTVDPTVLEAAKEMIKESPKPPSAVGQSQANLVESLQKAQDFAERMERLRRKMEDRSRQAMKTVTSKPADLQATGVVVPSLPPNDGGF